MKSKYGKRIRNLLKKLTNSTSLFRWEDGPLIQAMTTGSFLLIDEISLASDSVLERLNSVLESDRKLLIPENL